ncbi:polyribonucleotide nucleotidyltransferase [Lysinibacillus contaminans]|uniref:Polyribonucleotide nucleotidyltransferase n=1 Tax=Lysinibacillus contaminans TaxID=1293441 RepID=A0ABR5JW65_9BACI|nr:putative motility protein [Lysinibacillus contaminans]KOS66405.1 polyribonucleotide nucleotidyltransferase [Lysinibacillus contaminans]
MDINSIMSSQLMELQQTVQMSVMQNALNLNTSAAVKLLEEMPQPQAAAHPYKGTAVDISV